MPQRLVAISAKTRDEGKNAKCGKRGRGESREIVENWETRGGGQALQGL